MPTQRREASVQMYTHREKEETPAQSVGPVRTAHPQGIGGDTRAKRRASAHSAPSREKEETPTQRREASAQARTQNGIGRDAHAKA